MKIYFSLGLIALWFCLLSHGLAQEKPRGVLTVQRTTIPNFIKDPLVTGNASKTDDVSATLPSTFILTSPTTGQSVYWSPPLCRILAIKKGKLATFRELIAEGAHPLGFSLGAIGQPKFFGYRMVAGNPEFLYTYGQLSIEEKFEFSSDGRLLRQAFKVTSNALDCTFSLPPTWRDTATSDLGKWTNNVLMLSQSELQKGFTITYHLDPSQLH